MTIFIGILIAVLPSILFVMWAREMEKPEKKPNFPDRITIEFHRLPDDEKEKDESDKK